jgi:hypothetical protein
MSFPDNDPSREDLLMKRKNMKVITSALWLAACLLLIGWPSIGLTQQEYESSQDFEESKQDFGKGKDERPPVSIKLWKEEDEEEESRVKEKWGGWGGPMVGGLVLDLSPIEAMTKDRDVSEFNETFTVIGGMGGLAYQNPNSKGWWRFGGMGFGGSQHESDRVEGDTRKAEMSIGGGGLFVEYHYPIASRLELGLGGAVGGGSLSLDAEGADLGILLEGSTIVDVDGDWSESEGFWFGYPYAGASFKITDWMRLEAVGGYLFMDADLSGADFVIDDSDMEMTDGDMQGGLQYMVRILFGFQLDRNRDKVSPFYF